MKWIFLFFLLMLEFLWNCSNDSLAGGSEIGNPETTSVVGLVFEQDGQTPAAGAVVRLRPENYLRDTSQINRQTLTGHGKDTIANENGQFVLSNLDTGKFFLEIKGQTSQGTLVPVYIPHVVDTLDLGSHILKKTSLITGQVENPSESSHSAYVQIYGLDRVAAVDPVTQQYVLEEIPEGDYTIKIVSSATNISPVEISASPQADDTLKISKVTLQPFYSDWRQQKTFHLNTSSTGADISSHVYNFPLLLRLSRENVDFDDIVPEEIRLANQKGEPLAFEIENWDKDLGKGEIWILMDTIYAGSSEQFLSLLWDNPGAGAAIFSNTVFSPENGFSAVWHFGRKNFARENQIDDRTGNGNHGLAEGNVSESGFKEGVSGQGIFFDGKSDYLSFPKTNNIPIKNEHYTISGWIKVRDMGVYSMVGWGEYEKKKSNAFRVAPDWEGGLRNYWYSHDLTVETGDISGNWHHVVAMYNGLKRSIFLDGVKIGEDEPGGHDVPHSANLTLGTACCDEFFPGGMDEFQISRVSRSDSWIKLSYQNQKPGQSFIEEPLEEWSNSTVLQLPLDSVSLSQDVNNYPLLLKLNSNNFSFDQAQPNGEDIRFSDLNGKRLSHEIEHWDPHAQTAAVWILQDKIPANLDTLFLTMYWGNPTAGYNHNPGQVFKSGSGFAAVWHLNGGDPGVSSHELYRNAADITGGGVDSINNNLKSGYIGPGASFREGDFITIPKVPASLFKKDSLSISVWVKLDSLDDGGGVIFTLGDNYGFRFTPTGLTFWTHKTGPEGPVFEDKEMEGAFLDGKWHFLTFQFSTSQSILYVDGEKMGEFAENSPIEFSRYSYGLIGKHISERNGLFQFFGSMDELRVYNRCVSQEWVELEYYLQFSSNWIFSNN